jgi:uncharacterized protein (DUF4415 family)
MTEKKRALGSDLPKVDAHVIQSDEYDEIPELTDEWFERADLHEGGKLIRRGRPKSPAPKRHINIRLSPRVLDYFKATGPGWQSRIDAALAEWIETREPRA